MLFPVASSQSQWANLWSTRYWPCKGYCHIDNGGNDTGKPWHQEHEYQIGSSIGNMGAKDVRTLWSKKWNVWKQWLGYLN